MIQIGCVLSSKYLQRSMMKCYDTALLSVALLLVVEIARRRLMSERIAVSVAAIFWLLWNSESRYAFYWGPTDVSSPIPAFMKVSVLTNCDRYLSASGMTSSLHLHRWKANAETTAGACVDPARAINNRTTLFWLGPFKRTLISALLLVIEPGECDWTKVMTYLVISF